MTDIDSGTAAEAGCGPTAPDRRWPDVVATSDLEVAAAALSDAYTELTMRLPGGRLRLWMQLQTVFLPSVRLGDLTLSSSTVRTGTYPCYAVCFPVRGRVRVTAGDQSSVVAGRRGVVISPGSPVDVEYLSDDCQVRTVLFERVAMEAQLSAMLGRSLPVSLRFAFDLDVRSGDGHFLRALDLLRTELAAPLGMASEPAMSAGLGRLVMAGLLLSQPHNYTDALRRPVAFQGPRAIRVAVEAIEERPLELATVADIAEASALSVRALEQGFRRHVGMSPMRYLRQVRLARAHEELVAADPALTTATVVAHNWGFAHYGRFSAEYRQVYGCTPSETLRAGSTGLRAGR